MSNSTLSDPDRVSVSGLRPVSSFVKDFSLSLTYILVSFILFLLGESLLLAGGIFPIISGFILIVFAVKFFLSNGRVLISAIQYKKAEPILEPPTYLRGVKPVCPYLNVSAGGFKCLIEFSNPFDIKDDLPRCHSEELSKLHWVEKAPQVFEALQQETGKSILNYLPALGNAKYEPAIPYLENMLKFPKLTKNYEFIIQSTTQIKSLSELEENYITFVKTMFGPKQRKQTHSSLGIDQVSAHESEYDIEKHTQEFQEILVTLQEIGAIIINEDDGTVELTEFASTPIFLSQWKLYSSSLVKQFTVASLGLFENKKLIPTFFSMILNSSDKKMIFYAKNALKRQIDNAVTYIITLFTSDELSEEKKILLFETCSVLKNEEMFEFLKDFIKQSNNDLLIAYAISAIGQFGVKGNSIIMKVLEEEPDDLILETGRASLIKTPDHTFDLILEQLKQDNLSNDFVQILISIIEELDYKVISAKVEKLSDEDQDEIVDLFEKYNLDDYLDLFLPDDY